jgi:quinoprotein glucose dehydrogenase
LAEIVAGEPAVAAAAARTAAQLGIAESGPLLHRMMEDKRYAGPERARLLEALQPLDYPKLDAALEVGLRDESPEVRLVARRLLARSNPREAVQELAAALSGGEVVEQQAALATLADIQDPAAAAVMLQAVQQLLDGRVPAEIQLDTLEASKKSTNPQVLAKLKEYEQSLSSSDPLAPHRAALAGGNAERGRDLFHHNVSLSCLRCHQVGDEGGRVGPNLSDVGKRKPREYLLESIVDPNRTISEGFGTLVVVTEDGLTRQGVVSRETDELVHLLDAEGRSFAVAKNEILARQQGPSSMPADLNKHLTPFDLRDLVEYMASLQSPPVSR